MHKQSSFGGGIRSYSNKLLRTEGREKNLEEQDNFAFKKGIIHPNNNEG